MDNNGGNDKFRVTTICEHHICCPLPAASNTRTMGTATTAEKTTTDTVASSQL
jgi:hypothetical protein